MRIEHSGIVFTGAPGGDRQSATFPIPCVGRTGRWFCTFRAAPSKGRCAGQRVLLTWSDDRGVSWTEPFEPFGSAQVDGRPGLTRVGGLTALDDERLFAVVNWVDFSDPEAPYFNEDTEGLLDSRIFTTHSEDGGRTWSPLLLMDTSPYRMPTPLTGPVLQLPGGELACQFELNKHYNDPEPWRHASVIMFSADGGRTWPRHTVVTQDPANRIFYWDQRAAVLPDGRILDLFWTFDRERATYRNIHARESIDGGRSWSPLWDTGVPGQPAPVFPLSDGSLAMAYVDRTDAPAIRITRSTDGGHGWSDDESLTVYQATGASQNWDKSSMQDAWSEMYLFSVGLPSTAPLDGGGALLVYYAGPETDVTSIRWATIR